MKLRDYAESLIPDQFRKWIGKSQFVVSDERCFGSLCPDPSTPEQESVTLVEGSTSPHLSQAIGTPSVRHRDLPARNTLSTRYQLACTSPDHREPIACPSGAHREPIGRTSGDDREMIGRT